MTARALAFILLIAAAFFVAAAIGFVSLARSVAPGHSGAYPLTALFMLREFAAHRSWARAS